MKAQVNIIFGAIEKGDSVLIQLSDDYHEKLKQKRARLTIEVYAFRTKEQEYMTLAGYQNTSIADNRLGVYIAILGIAYCIFSIREMYVGFAAYTTNPNAI